MTTLDLQNPKILLTCPRCHGACFIEPGPSKELYQVCLCCGYETIIAGGFSAKPQEDQSSALPPAEIAESSES